MTTVSLKHIAKINFGVLDKSEKEAIGTKWVTTANLLPNNVLANYEQNLHFEPLESLSIKSGDILIRRIAPNYINYLNENEPNCYAANNLILVRAEKANPKYLAYYLDKNIARIIKKAAKGTVLPTLARQDLDEFEITLPPPEIQDIIGELWFLENEKIKLQKRLMELENKKLHYLLDKSIKQLENNNDNH